MSNRVNESPVTLEQYETMNMEQRQAVWLEISDITEEQFKNHMFLEKEREKIVPQVGSNAPDFIADVLGPNRQRTGEQVKLSDLRGKPVGLTFGSFT